MRFHPARWGAGFLAWTVLALLSVSQSAVWQTVDGRQIDWAWLTTSRFTDWYSCAIFTPLLFWLARRSPLGPGNWWPSLPIHLLVVAVISLLKFVVQQAVVVDLFGYELPPLQRMLVGGFIMENVAFWCVVGVIHAVEFHQRVREREVLTSRLSARLSSAQLEALSARLQPHFLFNTLQAISTLVYRDPAAADSMLRHLSNLLRRTLQRDPGHEVALTTELTMLDEYLAIQQVRFGERLSVVREVDPESGKALVPHFVLQPLVENAIEHGITRRAGAGRIAIATSRENGQLQVRVSDDGIGLGSGSAPREGTGLGATRQRLRELYGDSASLTLNAVPSGGVEARLVLPYHEQPVVGAEATG
jgi:two-component system LytT family sensor kinase